MLTSKIIKQTIENLFRFNAILLNHKITYEKTPLPRLSLVWKVRDSMPLLSDVPACRYHQSQPRYITFEDVCVQESHAAKRLIS